MGLKGDFNFAKNIFLMQIGEKGWIHPSALIFDPDGKPFLNLEQTVQKNAPEGEENLYVPIVRYGEGEGEYDINVANTYHRFESKEKPNFDEENWCDNDNIVPLDSKKPFIASKIEDEDDDDESMYQPLATYAVDDLESKTEEPLPDLRTPIEEREIDLLQRKLEKAQDAEDYETCAQLRDKMNSLSKGQDYQGQPEN